MRKHGGVHAGGAGPKEVALVPESGGQRRVRALCLAVHLCAHMRRVHLVRLEVRVGLLVREVRQDAVEGKGQGRCVCVLAQLVVGLLQPEGVAQGGAQPQVDKRAQRLRIRALGGSQGTVQVDALEEGKGGTLGWRMWQSREFNPSDVRCQGRRYNLLHTHAQHTSP